MEEALLEVRALGVVLGGEGGGREEGEEAAVDVALPGGEGKALGEEG